MSTSVTTTTIADRHGSSSSNKKANAQQYNDQLLVELVYAGDLECLQGAFAAATLANQITVDVVDDHGCTLLHHAAGVGNVSMCQWLLERIRDDDDDSSSSSSSSSSSFSVVDRFLYARSRRHGRTALHWAARNGHTDVVRLLVRDWKIDVNVEARGGVTGLELAVWQQHLTTCKVLVNELGADLLHTNSWGCGLVHWLGKSVYSDDDTSRLLNVNTSNKDDNSDTFHSSITSLLQSTSTWELCHWLHIDCGLDLTRRQQNRYGQTCLHKAAYAGNYIVCMYLRLVCHVVDDIRDQQHNLAADCAERNSQPDLAKWLRRYASPCIWKTAFDGLGLLVLTNDNDNDCGEEMVSSSLWSLKMPSLKKVRSAYLAKVREFHPDCHISGVHGLECKNDFLGSIDPACTNPSWYRVQDAYNLLTTWWLNPQRSDEQIRQRTRHTQLQANIQLLKWNDEWHQAQLRTATDSSVLGVSPSTNNSPGSCSRPNFRIDDSVQTAKISVNAMERLRGFELHLVKLLSSMRPPHHELPLSQLPKEYRKVWGCSPDIMTKYPVPNPKQYRCKRLSHVLQKYCNGSMEVIRFGEPNSIQRVRLRTVAMPNQTEPRQRAQRVELC